MIPLSVGIDPGSSSSPTGLAIIRMDTGRLIHATAITGPKKGTWWNKMSEIEHLMRTDINTHTSFTDMVVEKVFIEETQFRFRLANLTFQRMVGMYGLMATRILRDPEGLVLISPTTVKKWIGGHGACEKPALARKAKEMFSDAESCVTMLNLIEEGEFDCTDAVAIALCYRFVDQIRENKAEAKKKRMAASKRKRERIAAQSGEAA